MGLFDFLKGSGKDIDKDKPKSEAQVSNEKIQELRNQRFKNNLRSEVDQLEIKIDNLDLRFDNGVVMVNGKVGSQADREKIIIALGNIKGISQVQDGIFVEKVEPESLLYTVKSGDTLSKIAREHYGDAKKYMVIFEANKPMLKDPDKIYVGQVLRIPPKEDRQP